MVTQYGEFKDNKKYFDIVVPNICQIWDENKSMERPQVENKIAEALKTYPKGSILFVEDFLDYGNSESAKPNKQFDVKRTTIHNRGTIFNSTISSIFSNLTSPISYLHLNDYH